VLTQPGEPRFLTALEQARQEAIRRGHDRIATRHLALGVLAADEGPVVEALRAVGIDPADLWRRLEHSLPRTRRARPIDEALPYSPNAQRVLALADQLHSEHGGGALLRAEDLLLALLAFGGDVARVCRGAGLREGPLREQLAGTPPGASLPFLSLQPASGAPVYQQIVDQIREAVAVGRLAADDRLPPVRQLAAELGIAPGTTARAYQELEQLGVVVTDGARGTRIAELRPAAMSAEERARALVGLLRPAVVAASYLGASAHEVREALEDALDGILRRDDTADYPTASPSAMKAL
jgi:GntR family transcriptional regulator